MDVQVEKTGPCAAVIKFTIPSDEAQSRYSQGLKMAGTQVRMKGFRPGKVPAHVIEKQAGAEIGRDVMRNFYDEALRQAVEQESLKPVTAPRIDDELEFVKGADVSREFTLELKPDFELAVYSGLEIEGQAVETNDDEVESTIADIRRQQARPEPAEDEGLTEEGMAVAKIAFVHEGEELLAREGMRISPATAPNGVDADKFKEALTGAKQGTTVEVPMTVPEEFDREELRGKDAVCTVELSEVFRLIQPEESELFAQFQVESAEELRTQVKEHLLKHKQDQENQRLESELFDQLVAAHQMPLPEGMLQSQIEAREARAVEQLQGQGADEEAAKAEVAMDAEATRDASEKSLRALFLVEAIGEQEQIQIGRDELLAELQQIAQRNGAEVNEVVEYYQQNNLLQQLSIELLERRVRALLREQANVLQPA
ncbi:MAG: trigger factor [Planctomycetota bacterium]